MSIFEEFNSNTLFGLPINTAFFNCIVKQKATKNSKMKTIIIASILVIVVLELNLTQVFFLLILWKCFSIKQTNFFLLKKAATDLQIKTVLNLHNKYRAMHGAPPLVYDSAISAISQKYADHLAATNTFKHSGNTFKGIKPNMYCCQLYYLKAFL